MANLVLVNHILVSHSNQLHW